MLCAMRLALCLVAALVLGGCITSGTHTYPRCDRNGDEHERRAC
jgi:hypothetical protein